MFEACGRVLHYSLFHYHILLELSVYTNHKGTGISIYGYVQCIHNSSTMSCRYTTESIVIVHDTHRVTQKQFGTVYQNKNNMRNIAQGKDKTKHTSYFFTGGRWEQSAHCGY